MDYQLEYDRVLNSREESFHYEEKKEKLTGISLMLRFSPVFAEIDGESYERDYLINGESYSLNSLVNISYNNQTKEFVFSAHEKIKGKYEVATYFKHVQEAEESLTAKELNKIMGYKAPMSIPEEIPKKEFEFLMKKYGHLFETDQKLQTCSYNVHELKKEEGI